MWIRSFISQTMGTLNFKWYHFHKYVPKYLKLIIFLALVSAFYVYRTDFIIVSGQMDSMAFYEELDEESSSNRLQACKLPSYHPFEKDVLSYFSNPRPIRSRISVLTYVDENGYLRYNESAFAESGYKIGDLSCFYQEISKIEGDDTRVSFGKQKHMTGKDKPQSDFTYVICKKYSWLPNVYSMYHAFVQKKSSIRPFADDTEIGVVVVGLDSVSRLNFMRQLPKSYQVITTALNGVVMKGFNKVGENTLPNLMAMLTGKQTKRKKAKTTFDDTTFIWDSLNKNKVATFYGEDCSKIMTFSWWGKGFKKSPTTHYFRPFWVAVDSSSLVALSSPMCLGALPKHQIYLTYLKSFLRAYRQHPIFMISLQNEVSHDYLNTVGVIDEDLTKFLMSSLNEGLLNRTVLFVLSDHGQRFDDFRKTKQGKAEDRMPMVSVILPKWFSQSYPQIVNALNINSKRLTSTYDLYSTFVDIFQKETATKSNITQIEEKKISTYEFEKNSLGKSLFQPVQLNRTCSDAGIPEIYCACEQETRKLQKNEEIAETSMRIIKNYINNEVLEGKSQTWNDLLKNYFNNNKKHNKTSNNVDLSSLEKCAKLRYEIDHAELTTKANEIQVVYLTFKTHPNSGLFEGSIPWPLGNNWEHQFHENILRINRYGNQSKCLNQILLRLLPLVRSVCYCT